MTEGKNHVGFGGELTAYIDSDEMTEEQAEMYEQMADIFAERFETFVQKNLDYGSSFLTAGEMDAIMDTGDGPFEDSQDANLYKLFTRIQDKDQRFYNLVFCNQEDQVGEKPEETAGDAAVYWLMIQWLLEHGGGDDCEEELHSVGEHTGEEVEVELHGIGMAVDEETGEIA